MTVIGIYSVLYEYLNQGIQSVPKSELLVCLKKLC